MTRVFPCWGNLSRAKTQLVQVISAILIACGAAQADAWEEFDARCLVPMENVALAQPIDLRHDKSFKNDNDNFSSYQIDGARLAISNGNMGLPQWCWMSVKGDDAPGFQDAAFEWRGRAQASGRYTLIDKPVLGFVLRSTDWREPKIDVFLTMQMKGSQFILRVTETDLES